MATFKALAKNQDIRELIKNTFDTDLDIAGGWGYTPEDATEIYAIPDGMLINQYEHMLTSMRANLEMNFTQEKENRYGAINANEIDREEKKIENIVLHKVTYKITAIKEDSYTYFIKEYKENYGKEGFDLNDHFKRREEATIECEILHYFKVS